MNLILLESDEVSVDGKSARVTGRRARHIAEVLRAEAGSVLRVGVIDGQIGEAHVSSCDGEAVEFTLHLGQRPPEPLTITLLLALPRPKAFRRVLQSVTAMGVKRVVLLNTARVEKSYWESPMLAPDAIREQLVLGLEQSVDTRLPVVEMCRRFKPFVEDELTELAADSLGLTAHPGALAVCPRAVAQPITLAIGPEGGFTEYEVQLLADHGMLPISLGERRLRVETVVPALLARLS